MLRALPGAVAALGTLALAPPGAGASQPNVETDPDAEVERAIVALAAAMQRAGWSGRNWTFVAGPAAVPLLVLDGEGHSFFRLTPPLAEPRNRTPGT